MRYRRLALTIAVTFSVAISAVVLVILFFDWNSLRPTINDRVSKAMGRRFEIAGDLEVHWSRNAVRGDWWPGPVISAHDVAIDNPAWAKSRRFAHLDAVELRLSLLPLLVHRVSISTIALTKPTIDLERRGDGSNTWTMTGSGAKGESSGWVLDVHDIVFDTGNITVRDAATKLNLGVNVVLLGASIPFADVIGRKSAAAATAKAASDLAFGVKVEGSFNSARITGSGKMGGLLALRAASQPFPFTADVHVGDVSIQATGSVTDPAAPSGLDMQLRLTGNSMAHLFPITGVSLPETPPFATDGHLTGTVAKGVFFIYSGFSGRVGASDLKGTLQYATGPSRPKLTGSLTSEQLLLADLGPLIGLDTGDAAHESNSTPVEGKPAAVRPAAGKVLPDEPFQTDRWRAMDADITFNGKRLVRDLRLPITDLQTHVVMEGGQLSLVPLSFGMAGGEANATIHLDGRVSPMHGDMSIDGRHFQLRQLFPTMKTMQDALGEVNADAKLAATGNSIATLLGSADGEVKLLMSDGVVSRELMELAGLNVANYVVVKLFGDEQVKINCAATDFVAKHGVMDTRVALFDTDNALINIDGSVNFADEQVDLDIVPHTKGLRIFSFRSPLYVKGTFAKPDVGVHTGKLLLRGGAAVALGVAASPIAALLPLIAPSRDKNVDRCGDVLRGMMPKA